MRSDGECQPNRDVPFQSPFPTGDTVARVQRVMRSVSDRDHHRGRAESRDVSFFPQKTYAMLLGFLFVFPAALAVEIRSQVFSDVRHIVAVDDYVGTEIVVRLDPASTRVTGQWDLYQGYDPLTIKLEGTLIGSRLKMMGIDSEWRPVFTATYSDKALNGVLQWHMGRKLHTKKIRLRRVIGRLEDLLRQK